MKKNRSTNGSINKRHIAASGTLLGGLMADEEKAEQRTKKEKHRNWLYQRAEWSIEALVRNFLDGGIGRDQLYPLVYGCANAALSDGWDVEIPKLVWRAIRDAEGADKRVARTTKPRTLPELHMQAYWLVEQVQKNERLPNDKVPPIRNTSKKLRGEGDWRDACERASQYMKDAGFKHASPESVEAWRKAYLREVRSNQNREI